MENFVAIGSVKFVTTNWYLVYPIVGCHKSLMKCSPGTSSFFRKSKPINYYNYIDTDGTNRYDKMWISNGGLCLLHFYTHIYNRPLLEFHTSSISNRRLIYLPLLANIWVWCFKFRWQCNCNINRSKLLYMIVSCVAYLMIYQRCLQDLVTIKRWTISSSNDDSIFWQILISHM